MIRAAVRKGLSWIMPEGALLGAAALALHADELHDAVREFARFYPYLVFGLGLLIAIRYQRSRLVFALLLLALVGWGLRSAPHGLTGRFMFRAAATLLPLNLAAITLMTERGTFTRTGLVRLGTLLAQVAAVAWAAQHAPARAAAIAGHRFLPADWFAWTRLAQLPVLAFAAAAALICLGILFQASPTGRAFLWALGAAFLALHSGRTGVATTIYGTTAALILVVAVVEASYLMAYQDGLTGLPARRALNEALQRMDGQFAIAMVDVDHFKKLNDRYGHDVGDQVLRMVASRLANVSGGGRAFRYGGEEFAVLFPGKGTAECLPELEALRRAVEESTFTLRRRLRRRRSAARGNGAGSAGGGRRQVAVTVSIGAAEPDGRHRTPEQVIEAADQALYRAKDGGRNRVEI
jgi:diguanylate cyclase (GGDEF)-like protein